MNRSLKIYLVLIIVIFMLSTSSVWAYESQLMLGATPVQEDSAIPSTYWFPISMRLLTPRCQPLAFWDSSKGIAPIIYQGLVLEMTMTPVGFNNLLGVDLGMPGPGSDGAPFDGKPSELSKDLWRSMDITSAGGYRWRGVVDCPWGSNIVLFRVRHKDAKGVTRIVFFKFTFMKEGSLQQAFVLNVQKAPDGWGDFTDAESHLYIRGFIPANASASDPELAAKLRAQRERRNMEQPVKVLSLATEQFGSARIQLLDSQGQPTGGKVAIRVVYPSGKNFNGIYQIPFDKPLQVNNLIIGSTIIVRPTDSKNSFTKNISPGETVINLIRRAE